MNDIEFDEHKLAKKAKRIFENQQELQKLKKEKAELQKEKPKAEKSQLSYAESIEFGKQVDRYEVKMQELELQILKLKRQLSALELQAKKLLPVAGVKIKVSTYSQKGTSLQTYSIQQVEEPGVASENSFKVEKL